MNVKEKAATKAPKKPSKGLAGKRLSFRKLLQLMYPCSAAERFTKEAALKFVLCDNPVSQSLPRAWPYRQLIEVVCSQSNPPLTLACLSPKLESLRAPRGYTALGQVADNIERIADSFALRWWIDEKGLTIDSLVLEPTFLIMATRLMAEHYGDNKLSDADLGTIARKLDEAGFPLLENLQPGQRARLALYNQRNPHKKLMTFQEAVKLRPSGNRAVRRKLYQVHRSASKLR